MKISKLLRIGIFLFCVLTPSLLSAQGPQRGEIIGQSLLKHYTTAEIQAVYTQLGLPVFLSPINYEIDLYKVQYWTPNAQGTQLVPATGVVCYPSAYPCGAPVMLYHHGTTFWDTGLPSDLGFEVNVGIVFAANGYLVVMPDYLGLGDSPGRHPYVHAASEASSSIDMLRSARILSDTLDVDWNEQLFLTGYSQGGHAGMATFREIETQLNSEFSITAVSLGAGPYDMSVTTRNAMLTPRSNLTNSYNMVYVILSYQEVYGTLYDSLSEYFVAPYDSLIPLIFAREGALTSLPLADTAINMLQPTVLQAVQADSLHPLNVALRDNDVYDWTPLAPVRLYYCEADAEVPYQNSVVARDQMVLNGSTSINAISAGATLDHTGCLIPTLIQTKLFFDSQRQLCPAASLDPAVSISLRVFPNPAHDQLEVSWDNSLAQVQRLQIRNVQGQTVLRLTENKTQFQNGSVSLSVATLSPGLYFLELNGKQTYHHRVIIR